MSWPYKAINDTMCDQPHLWCNASSTNENINSHSLLEHMTVQFSRYLDYDIAQKDREKIEFVENSTFSVPVVDASSQVTLSQNNMSDTVSCLLETFGEHAQCVIEDKRLDLKSKETVKKCEQRKGTKRKSGSSGSNYVKKCLVCNEGFKNVKQLVSHFMSKSHEDFHSKLGTPVPPEQNVTIHLSRIEQQQNNSVSRMDSTDVELPPTSCKGGNKRKKQSSMRKHMKISSLRSGCTKMQENSSNIRRSQYVKPHKGSKNISRDIPEKKTLTCTVNENSPCKRKARSFAPQFVKQPMASALIPVNTSQLLSTASITHPVTTYHANSSTRVVEPSSALQAYSTAQVVLSSKSATATNSGQKPLEIMKQLTCLLALYKAKVLQNTDKSNSLVLSIPNRSGASLVPLGNVGNKRNCSSMEECSDFDNRSHFASYNQLDSYPQESILLEPDKNCLQRGTSVSKTSSTTVLGNNFVKSSNTMVVSPNKPLNAQNSVNIGHPSLSSGNWLFCHLSAPVTTPSTASQSRVNETASIPGRKQESGSTMPSLSQDKTEKSRQKSVYCPAVKMSMSPAPCHKFVQAQVGVNQQRINTLSHGIPTINLIKKSDYSVLGNRIQRHSANEQANFLGVEGSSKAKPCLLRPAMVVTCGNGTNPANKAVTPSGQTKDLRQSSIFLQPMEKLSSMGRNLVHVPLLDVQHEPMGVGDSTVPAASDPQSSHNVCAVSNVLVPHHVPADNSSACSGSQPPTVKNKTIAVPQPAFKR